MAFQLVSSSEGFLRRLSEAFGGLSGVTVVADNILIYGKGGRQGRSDEQSQSKFGKAADQSTRS